MAKKLDKGLLAALNEEQWGLVSGANVVVCRHEFEVLPIFHMLKFKNSPNE
ncbi:MAG: hypothetical protein ACJAXM_000936 [Arenicella sp.]